MLSFYNHVIAKYGERVISFLLLIIIGGGILVLSFGAVLTSLKWWYEEPSLKHFAIATFYLLFVSAIAYPLIRQIVETFNPRTSEFRADDFRVRIVPYFEKAVAEKVDSKDHPFFFGRQIAKNLRKLDGYARQAGARPLSSFGFKDDKIGEKVRWHDPNDGLLTIQKILDGLQEQGRDRNAFTNFDILMTELKLVRDWLRKASEANVRFALVTRMAHESDLSWSYRKGSFT